MLELVEALFESAGVVCSTSESLELFHCSFEQVLESISVDHTQFGPLVLAPPLLRPTNVAPKTMGSKPRRH